MNETMPTARPDADYSLGETFSIGLRMAQFDGAAIAASTSSRMGLLWPILFGVVGGVASPALLNPLAWIPIGLTPPAKTSNVANFRKNAFQAR